jgi:hypothetical protein
MDYAKLIRWTDAPNNSDVDPFTEEYGLLDLRNDEEKRVAYEILYLMFHEMGHAVDWYYSLFSAKTDLGDNTEIDWGDYVAAGFGGVPFSLSPAWTRVDGVSERCASGWQIEELPNGKARWVPFAVDDSLRGLVLEDYYQETGAATTPDGYDPPVSLRSAFDPFEDFAECFALYMLNRNYFSEVFPVKYAAMETYLDEIKDFRREVFPEQ